MRERGNGRDCRPPVRPGLAGRRRADDRPDQRDGARRPPRGRPRRGRGTFRGAFCDAKRGTFLGTFRGAAPAREEDEAARLAVTVAQLEHALVARVRVEQAIGVLAERHRLRPREAFDLLRSVARSGGERVIDVAESVVDSASNPLLPLPEELARPQPAARRRGRSPRHARIAR
jgi:hypothetical protein